MFTEQNTVERMILDTLSGKGAAGKRKDEKGGAYLAESTAVYLPHAPAFWRYVPAENLPRAYSDVLVEEMVRKALVRLNPEIEQKPERAEEVIYKLRAILLSVQADGLVRANEHFTQWLRGEKTMPFGKNGEHRVVRLLSFDKPEKNECIVTTQWVYPGKENGRRFDIVLLVNGIPLVIGEAKTPVRPSVTWLDGASDIRNGYEETVPQMFVPNVLSFATEGKMFR